MKTQEIRFVSIYDNRNTRIEHARLKVYVEINNYLKENFKDRYLIQNIKESQDFNSLSETCSCIVDVVIQRW